MKTKFLLTLTAIMLSPCMVLNAAEPTPPNVVLIFADDLGYGDLGCYGATKVRTPNIDSLARDGRRFTDAHSSSAVCTPSRYGLITGEYPSRANGGKGVWGPAPVTSGLLVDTEKQTIADVFKSSGYATAVLGKWHLGFGKGQNTWKQPLRPGPQDLGFDYYFGLPVVNSAPPYVYIENDRVVGAAPDDPLVYLGRKAGKDATPITPLPPEAGNRVANFFSGAATAHKLYNDYSVGTTLTKKATNWIEVKKDTPFFLFLATTHIHHPFTPAPRFQGTSDCGLYGDFIHELDWMVGEVLACLEENGLSDNTLVIFTSDNGGMFNHGGQEAFKHGHQQNGELLGFKFGVWEGGHRVPFIARWPGHIKPGTTSEQLISGVDMLATFASLTGQTLDKKQQADSINVLPALVSDPAMPLRETLVLPPHKSANLAIRKGKWMYIGAQGAGGFGGGPGAHAAGGPVCISFVGSVNSDIEDGKIKQDAPPAQLYDLEADVGQTKNLYNEFPEVVQEMSALLATYTPKKNQATSPKNGKGKPAPARKGKPAKKMSATPSTRSASFDFESGRLAPWKVVEGKFGHPIGSRSDFIGNIGTYNKQGEFYLSTLETSATADRGSDHQTGVIESPLFLPKGGEMTFRIGGGSGPDTYAALCKANGKEVLTARGINNQEMQQANWDLTPYAGEKMFIRIVDQSTTGWGHITADNFQFDGEILTAYRGASTDGPAQVAIDRPAPPRHSKSKPNIVVIFTDDQGYGDLSCFGGKHVSTPRIDQMAKEGARLTSFYMGAPLCTPSRAALMTGCYPRRIDMAYGSDFAVLLAGDTKGLNPDEVTIAEVMKDAGYATGMFGKWHLGDQPEFLPTRQGFDEFFGIPYSHDIHPQHPRQDHFKFPPLPLLEGEKVIELDPDADYLTQRFTERAVQFIETHKNEPFFLYVPHPLPHGPLHVSPEFMEGVPAPIKARLAKDGANIHYGTRIKLFKQVISEIDWAVGQILDTLKANGLDENTLVIFTTDNGPAAAGSAGPLRGKKGSTFDGGPRVPAVVRWPGQIPAGQAIDEMLTAMDLLPTFAKLAGGDVPTDRVIDGKDIWPVLTQQVKSPHESIFVYRDNALKAVRSGKWKLHLTLPPGKDPEIPLKAALYDLENDIGEKSNVLAQHPEVAKRLAGFAAAFEKDLANNNRPAGFVENPRPFSQ